MPNHPRRNRHEIIADAMVDSFLLACEGAANDGLRSFRLSTTEIAALVDVAHAQFGQGKRFSLQVGRAITASALAWNEDCED